MAERRAAAAEPAAEVALAEPGALPDAEGADAAPAPPSALDRLLERVSSIPSAAAESAESALLQSPESAPAPLPALARLALVQGVRWSGDRELEVRVRGVSGTYPALVGDDVDAELVSDAIRDRQLLLAEWPDHGVPLVVGVVQARPPSRLRLRAEEIELDAARELLLRSGGAALRLRASGEVELVGSRISAVSRGVMRLIGRLLRLN